MPIHRSKPVTLLVACLATAVGAKVAPFDLDYRVRFSRPATHLLEIEIVASQLTEPAVDFVMPAWSPGRYAIYDFAKNVQEFKARGAQDQPLVWQKLDKQTWRVSTQTSGGTVRVSYGVYANDLSGSFSQLDTSHASVNGGSVFMYLNGHKADPLRLEVEAPAGWKVISEFSESVEQKTFRVPSYDLLVDTPLELSPEVSLDEFQERGKTFRVAVHAYTGEDSDRSKLLDGLRKIVRSEMAMMPTPDFRHYTFIFHFTPDVAVGDGMEHLNSTEIILRQSLASGVDEAVEAAAHEFFHLWNVKRLRPAALGPFDYTRENHTPSLWFAEGLTSYYADLNLLRSGLWDRKEFLRRLAGEIRSLESEPGRTLMSAESASFNAWFYDRSPQMQETNFANSTISYYNKGLLIGLLLDLEIRARTGGQKSLDDVMASMYRRFYQDAPAGAYGRGSGYTENDILESFNSISGSDFRTFFDRYVRGAEPLPYAEELGRAGLELRVATSEGAPPSLGVLTQKTDRGPKIVVVRRGEAADRAGLSRDDVLVATDHVPLGTDELGERLKFFTPGASASFTIERHGRKSQITVTLDPPQPDTYTIKESADATPAQIRIRDGWLGKAP